MTADDRPSFRQPFAVLLFFIVLAGAWLWPLPARLSTRIAHDPGDPVLNTWILWWNAQALPLSAEWWNAPIFHPMAGAFALSEHLAGIGLFTAPLLLAGVHPVAGYNLALIAACALSGFFTYLLVRDLTGSTAAGVISGVAFAFAPYRGSQLAHLQVLNAQWIPLALYAAHRYLSGGSARWLALLGGAWVAQALSNGYFLLFFPVLLAPWLAWFGTGSFAPHAVPWRRAGAVTLTLAVASVALIPVLLRYRQVHAELGITRTVEEMIRFSASPGSLLHAAPLAAFWPEAATPTQETHLFTGLTIALLAIAGVAGAMRTAPLTELIRRRSPAIFYFGSAVLMYWLAIGPARTEGVQALLFPYTALTWLPGFEGLRAPARFATFAILGLAITAGFATVWLIRLQPRLRLLATAIVFAGLFIDGWIEPLPLVAPPQRVLLPERDDAVVLELPAYDLGVNIGAMYRAINHRVPLVNGFSGHVPPHYTVLNTALLREDPSVLWWLARGRPLLVIVHRRLDPDRQLRRFVEGAGGILHEESGVGPVFVIPPRPREREFPPAEVIDNVEASLPRPAVTLADLGGEHVVRGVSFSARWRSAEVPERMTIEHSVDGATWTTVWEDWTGGHLLSGALEHQRDVVVRIPLPDVRARFIRIQPSPRWLPGELRVHAAAPASGLLSR